jgi:hypothetical protein
MLRLIELKKSMGPPIHAPTGAPSRYTWGGLPRAYKILLTARIDALGFHRSHATDRVSRGTPEFNEHKGE